MEIKITINVGNNDPIEVKVDIPEKVERTVDRDEPQSELGEDAKWFDNFCTGWTSNAELNKIFLLRQQDYCNELLRAKGYLFLNEVYDCLGMTRTRRGQSVGWTYNEGRYNYVDFGIFADHNRAFINGLENRALLNFNVDGDILGYL